MNRECDVQEKKALPVPGQTGAQAAAAGGAPKTMKVGEMTIQIEQEVQKMERLLQLVKDAPPGTGAAQGAEGAKKA